MKWVKPVKPGDYSKSQVDWAGQTIAYGSASNAESILATEIFENWRAIHSYPMWIFKKRLKDAAKKIDKNALTAQRLKRTPSIINKLKRRYYNKTPTMKLSQMQDIGGCRVVLRTNEMVFELLEKYYLKGDLKHKLIRKKDYVSNPKEDGYRSVHLIYSYISDKQKKMYNGLLVEIQLRSKLQHLWATAIETVDFFTLQAIKSNQGKKEWKEFFKLVSSAFAIMENKPLVSNTPINQKELFSTISKFEKELNVIRNLENWAKAIEVITDNQFSKKTGKELFLLELDIANERLTVRSYSKNQSEKAILDYNRLEKQNYQKSYYDIVLVGLDDARDLEKTYPNYFADTKEFIHVLKGICQP